MAITDDMLDELLKDYQKPEDLLGQNGLLKQGSSLFSVEQGPYRSQSGFSWHSFDETRWRPLNTNGVSTSSPGLNRRGQKGGDLTLGISPPMGPTPTELRPSEIEPWGVKSVVETMNWGGKQWPPVSPATTPLELTSP